MRLNNINMKITCNKAEILGRLKANLESHTKLVAEARTGYVSRAKEELDKKLKALSDGKVVALTFSLRIPQDYSTIYKTAISMLEAHTGTEIELSASEYRQLVEDEWDWAHDFAGTNMLYSAGTRDWAVSKGMELAE